MATRTAALSDKETAEFDDLYVSFELGDKQWRMTVGNRRGNVSRHIVCAGDTVAVSDCMTKIARRLRTGRRAQVHSCYEAGRDGWWLHRWLTRQGVDSIVVDPASIEVNRRARRAKTDRLDGDKLLAMLVRHHAGEHVWSVLHEPSPQDEDARRVHRELQRLDHERITHTNRIGALLVLHNLRPGIIAGRDWVAWWHAHREQVPLLLGAEIEREIARLRLVKEQIRAIEATTGQALAVGQEPLVAQLTRLRAIGPKGAWVLVKEVFGWRHFANRRELASSLGLVPTPYASGNSEIEQGISKAGNRRVRSLLVEQAWNWLRLQPGSALSEWFNRRFAGAGKRMRRVGIVALARRLAIALWRYLQDGVIPSGAQVKAIAARA